jgi:putative heme-binding domain-containing protein
MTLHAGPTFLLVSAVIAGSGASGFAQSLEVGRKAYEARCAGCHGSDGTGGSQGPDIVDRRQPRARSSSAMRDLIRNGIPGTGMPAFPVPDAELDAIVSYISVLKAPAADNPRAGDAMAGERFFSGKGNCSSCHMVQGRGGILGPDLSNLGRERKTPQIEQAIREPGVRRKSAGDDDAQSFRAVSLRMRDGRTLRGLAKYESPFDLGVQSLDGRFHSISRAQVADITWEPSLMPRVQASTEELRDLLAYLTRLAADRSPRATLPGTAAVTVNDGMRFADIVRPKPGEWPTYHGQLSGNRHSPLDQINRANVARLAPKWTVQVPGARGALQGARCADGSSGLALQPSADIRTCRRSRKRDQSRRGGPRRSDLPANRSRASRRTPQDFRTAPLGCRDGRLSRALWRDERAARGQRLDHRRRFRRR